MNLQLLHTVWAQYCGRNVGFSPPLHSHQVWYSYVPASLVHTFFVYFKERLRNIQIRRFAQYLYANN